MSKPAAAIGGPYPFDGLVLGRIPKHSMRTSLARAWATMWFVEYPSLSKEVLMSMVCGLDLHRQQITFDALDSEFGEVWRGRMWWPDRKRFRRWLRYDVAGRAHGQPAALLVLGCTGWRYVSKR